MTVVPGGSGPVRLGFWMDAPDQLMLEALAEFGVDVVVFDGEHGAFGADALWRGLGVARAHGLEPFVRVPYIERTRIGNALDWGAAGVILPGVASADDVREAVDYASYPPDGTRGFGPRRVQDQRRAELSREDYFRGERRRRVVWSQIETLAAADAIYDILAVDGLAGVLVGPMDLTGELGGFAGVDVTEQLDVIRDEVINAARDRAVPVGVVEPAASSATLQERVEQGCEIVSIGTQSKLIASALGQRTADVRGMLPSEALAGFRRPAEGEGTRDA